jgi:uncharacterized protein (TIGR03000 family)
MLDLGYYDPSYDQYLMGNEAPNLAPGGTWAYTPPRIPRQSTAPTDNLAHIEVRAPADAEIWFGSGKTTQTGSIREFVSPPLSAGHEYTYEVRARWNDNGQEVVQTRRIDVSAGSWKTIDFTKPPPAEPVEPPAKKS